MSSSKLNRRFAALVSKGNIHAAISLITENNAGGVLALTPEVCDALKEKHPKAQHANQDALLQGEIPSIHPILFDCINDSVVHKIALTIQGAAGPSMADSFVWRRMLVSFKAASTELCSAVADLARRLSTEHVDPFGLMPLLNNCLIPFDKSPIGVGETFGASLGKLCYRFLVMTSCLLQEPSAGCEAAIHALRKVFASLDSDAY